MWSKQFWSSILRTWRAKTICSTRASARSRVAFLSQNAPRKKHGTPGTPHADWQHILLDTLVNFTKRNQAPNFKDTKAKGAASSAEARNSNLGDQAKTAANLPCYPLIETLKLFEAYQDSGLSQWFYYGTIWLTFREAEAVSLHDSDLSQSRAIDVIEAR